MHTVPLKGVISENLEFSNYIIVGCPNFGGVCPLNYCLNDIGNSGDDRAAFIKARTAPDSIEVRVSEKAIQEVAGIPAQDGPKYFTEMIQSVAIPVCAACVAAQKIRDA